MEEFHADEVFAAAKKKSNLSLFVDLHPEMAWQKLPVRAEVGGRQRHMVQIRSFEVGYGRALAE
jgi:hypothetical protein